MGLSFLFAHHNLFDECYKSIKLTNIWSDQDLSAVWRVVRSLSERTIESAESTTDLVIRFFASHLRYLPPTLTQFTRFTLPQTKGRSRSATEAEQSLMHFSFTVLIINNLRPLDMKKFSCNLRHLVHSVSFIIFLVNYDLRLLLRQFHYSLTKAVLWRDETVGNIVKLLLLAVWALSLLLMEFFDYVCASRFGGEFICDSWVRVGNFDGFVLQPHSQM
jgi:hypothetical protein